MDSLRPPTHNLTNLLFRIGPQAGEISRAQTHASTVKTRLRKSFVVKDFRAIGSHVRGTAIKEFSDADYLAILARDEARWAGAFVESTTTLERIRQDLSDRYTTTAIRRDGQAIVISFASGQRSMDVVPAVFDSFHKLHPVYVIPDGEGGWRQTSPSAHNQYIKQADVRSGGKLKYVIRLLKWWKHSRQQRIPISSFYIELVLASTDVCTGIKSYSECLRDAFATLANRKGRGIRDPLGIAGIISSANTPTQASGVSDALSHAAYQAEVARFSEVRGKYDLANDKWTTLFNGRY